MSLMHLLSERARREEASKERPAQLETLLCGKRMTAYTESGPAVAKAIQGQGKMSLPEKPKSSCQGHLKYRDAELSIDAVLRSRPTFSMSLR